MTTKKQAEFIIKNSKTLFKDGHDVTGNNLNTILHLKFKQKDAYIYVTSDGMMHGAFGNDWKWQHTELNYDESKIWKYIRALDRNNYICLNDVYDEVNKIHEDFWDRFDNDELNPKEQQLAERLGDESDIVDFVKTYEKLSNDQCLIVEFIEEIDTNISNLQETAWNQKWSDQEFLLQSILALIVTDTQFFEEHISIDAEIIRKMKSSTAVNTYNKIQQMKKLQLELKTKEEKKHLNKV